MVSASLIFQSAMRLSMISIAGANASVAASTSSSVHPAPGRSRRARTRPRPRRAGSSSGRRRPGRPRSRLHVGEQVAVVGLVDAHHLLHRLRRQPDLVAERPSRRLEPATDVEQLDLVGVDDVDAADRSRSAARSAPGRARRRAARSAASARCSSDEHRAPPRSLRQRARPARAAGEHAVGQRQSADVGVRADPRLRCARPRTDPGRPTPSSRRTARSSSSTTRPPRVSIGHGIAARSAGSRRPAASTAARSMRPHELGGLAQRVLGRRRGQRVVRVHRRRSPVGVDRRPWRRPPRRSRRVTAAAPQQRPRLQPLEPQRLATAAAAGLRDGSRRRATSRAAVPVDHGSPTAAPYRDSSMTRSPVRVDAGCRRQALRRAEEPPGGEPVEPVGRAAGLDAELDARRRRRASVPSGSPRS